MKKTFPLALTIAFLVSAIAFTPSCFVQAQSGAIASAQDRLNSCYELAKQAEAAGANITALQDTLNVAGTLLSKAQHALSQGDAGGANNFAQQAQSALSGFESKANGLRDEASRQTQTSFLFVVGSIAGTFAVIGVSTAVWTIQKRKNPRNAEAETVES
jgi:hypothetical protein